MKRLSTYCILLCKLLKSALSYTLKKLPPRYLKKKPLVWAQGYFNAWPVRTPEEIAAEVFYYFGGCPRYLVQIVPNPLS